MSDDNTLAAELRDVTGKGAARTLRREGKIPAVIYGDKKPPVSLTLAFNELNKRYRRGGFLKSTLKVEVDGKSHLVLPKAVQMDPVYDMPVHVDFMRIKQNATLEIMVNVEFLNHEASPGLKRGGTLNVVRHEVELAVPATAIPDKIQVDLTGMEIGHVIHISEVNLPDNCVPTITDRDFTVATISGKGAMSDGTEETTEEVAEE
ncbi:MAG TPA: 50S ribosomal protein L25 [Alphaproteobacteria bacterium]|nr:50S ribosomal protein L25/general stress protein Ctc [Paracoccaceae bacterium]RCL78825.1 MAG: 50S ribosomal protein L25/general stress protein Ctc [SAR116 cluster bacterium]HBQ22131.1 50S ribosomal protein L25 [Alphaproteobacteria bacterium]HCJ62314.1 50S ribosomal protein L25 [Alphaproteobacteria bacterium]HCY47620.1 50S ribosomal protein L25 [Alphaproteobacteria bacterium]